MFGWDQLPQDRLKDSMKTKFLRAAPFLVLVGAEPYPHAATMEISASAWDVPAAPVPGEGPTQRGPRATPNALAIADTVQRLVQAAFVREDRSGLEEARRVAERGLEQFPEDPLLLHYVGYVDFRLAALLLQTDGSDEEVRALVGLAQASLARSAELHPLPETYALLSAIEGIKVAVGSKLGAPFAVRRANAAMAMALALGPENPRAWLIQGIHAAEVPRLFGGGRDKARVALERALQLFESDPAEAPWPVWGKAEAYAWLGIIQARMGERELARQSYEAALLLEPESKRIREVLLPRLDR